MSAFEEQMKRDMEAVFLSPENTQPITIYPCQGSSAYGAAFGPSYVENAYLEAGFKMVTDAKGKEVVSSLYGLFRAECPITVGDEASWSGKRYRVIAADPDGAGIDVRFTSVGR